MRPHSYDAYGFRASPTHDAHTAYTGQVVEVDMGGYMLGSRLYLAVLRRFLAPDPASPFDDGGMNRYAYGGGDPINRVDPTGNAWWDWIADTLGRMFDGATESFVSAVTAPAMASLAASTPRPLAPISTVRKSDYVRNVFEFREGKSRIKHYEGRGAVTKKIPHRLEVLPGFSSESIRTQWHAIANRNGGINHAADTRVSHIEVVRLMDMIGQKKNDSLPIIVLSGVHGAPSGLNWVKGRRFGKDASLYTQDVDNHAVMAGFSRRQPEQLNVVDIGQMSTDDFIELTERPAHVVHSYCYGAADRLLMSHYAVGVVKVYDL